MLKLMIILKDKVDMSDFHKFIEYICFFGKFADINKKNNNSLAEFLKYDINLIPTKSEINEFIDQVDDIKSRTEKLLKKMK